jgi:hypothetical protein
VETDVDSVKPFVLVTVEFMDGKRDMFFIGEEQEYYTWLINADQQLVFQTHRYTNRTVIPLCNVRAYHVNRNDAQPREKGE